MIQRGARSERNYLCDPSVGERPATRVQGRTRSEKGKHADEEKHETPNPKPTRAPTPPRGRGTTPHEGASENRRGGRIATDGGAEDKGNNGKKHADAKSHKSNPRGH